MCSSFVAGREHGLQQLAPGTLYLPHATSLRMGRLGYQSEAQASLAVSYNSLESYGASLYDALTKPYPPYEKIGIRDERRLSPARHHAAADRERVLRHDPPEAPHPRGERPLHALRERGVEYVEVRLMDLDPFVPTGITAQTMRFLDVFLLHCLLRESPADTPEEVSAHRAQPGACRNARPRTRAAPRARRGRHRPRGLGARGARGMRAGRQDAG